MEALYIFCYFPFQIREDLKKGIHVENITELEVTSAREVMQQLLQVMIYQTKYSLNLFIPWFLYECMINVEW